MHYIVHQISRLVTLTHLLQSEKENSVSDQNSTLGISSNIGKHTKLNFGFYLGPFKAFLYKKSWWLKIALEPTLKIGVF